MRASVVVGWVVLSACQGASDDDDGDLAGVDADLETEDTDTDTGTSGPTTDDTGTVLLEGDASCVNSPNPLVFECTASLPAAGPATLVLSAAGLPTRIFESGGSTVAHDLLGWGLLADTEYTWELAGKTGTLSTGSLPPGLSGLDVDVEGTLFGIDAVLVYVDCGWFVMLDGEGRVIWAMPTATYDAFSDGMMWSQADRTVLAVRDSTMGPDESVATETDLTGIEVLRLEPGDFSLQLTHDVGRWRTYTYLLGERGDEMGGFEVWEGTSYLGTFLLDEAFPSVQNLDDAHVNGLSVSEAGEVVLSLHAFDAVVAIDGDPASPTFLQLLWHAAGAPGGFSDDLPDPDYLPVDAPAFVKQHNASRHGDDLWVFDNRSDPDARALRLAMNPADGTLTETGSWSTNESCINQGGALPIAGGALVTCANEYEVYAFQDGSAVPDWTLHADCPENQLFGSSTRAFPVVVE